ncbi:aminotransferase class IV [Microbulbifer echini]|uniref:Aminotransferase class IV n=1 Tax=Microbulbifer echini TaxID=1529067 RepID=A0ABV4NMR8_9GAMM
MLKLPQCFHRGQLVQSLPADGHYQNGILETMRCHNGRLPLWPLHRRRLARSTLPAGLTLDEIEKHLFRLVAELRHREAIVRLRLGRVSGSDCWDLTFLPLIQSSESELGVHLFPCETYLPVSKSWNSGCKLLHRSRYNRAKSELPEGEHLDGLMLDSEGRVIESLRCNLLARFGDAWVTPSLQRCGVRGVMLDWLHGRIQWQERDMDIRALCGADELALCNSVRGIMPVIEIIGHKSWPIGAGVQGLQHLIVESLW